MAENTFEAKKYLDLTGLSHFWTLAHGKISTELAKKVDKVSGMGLSTNDFTTAEKNKLSGISALAEVNQNAFSNVTVGTTTIASGSKTDTFEIAGGDGVSVSASGKKITISVAGSGGSLEDTSISNGSISDSTISGSTLSGTTTASSNSTVDLDAASTVTVPTATAGDSSKKAASTEFVGTAITNATSGLGTRLGTAEGNITNLQTAVTTLNGNANTAGSVANTVSAAINDFATKVSDDGTINTFKEMIDYAAAHKNEYSTLSGSVQVNTNAIAALDAKTVDGPTQSVTDRIATFADTTGKVIKDSGFTIATSVPANAKFTDTTYGAGTGLSLSGTTFNHSNSVTAKTAFGSTATTASANGGKIVVTDVKYDAQGHITGTTDRTITLSQDHTKTSVSAGTAGQSGASSGATLAVPYVTVNADGHVTGYGTHTHTISGFLTKETYKGTVTSVATGKGLTGGTITGSGTIKCNLNSETSLGTIGSTSKLYAVGVDANNKLCVNVPWTDNNTTYTAMSLDEAKTGTATTARTITAAVLDDKIEDKAATVAITTAEIDAIIAEIG